MDYFLLKQDERYTNVPLIQNISEKIDRRHINIFEANKIDDVVIFHVNADKESCFLDIMDGQLYLISQDLKKTFELYEPNMLFKMVVLIDMKHQRQENYFLPIMKEIDVLGPSCEFNLDKSVIKKLVLDNEKVKGKKIFKIRDDQKHLIVVRLDAAESILRRDFKGIKLEKVFLE